MAPTVLTVEQLANLAMGGRDEAKPNVFVLQSLLHILIEKLNLGNEKVELEGPGTEILEELAKGVKPSIAVKEFNVDPKSPTKRSPTVKESSPNNLFIVKRQLDTCDMEEEVSCGTIDVNCRVDVLENLLQINNDRVANLQGEIYEVRRKQGVDERARNHKIFNEVIDECNKCRCDENRPNIPFCIDSSDPFNELALGLLSNREFLIELMKKISCPILDKVNNWENQLQIMGDLFQKFIDRAEEEFERKPTVESNALAIETLRQDLEAFKEEFLFVCQEIQEMLDAKLDKVHIPPLKKFITDEFGAIYEILAALKKNEHCPEAMGTTKVLVEDLNCFSCAGKVCQRVKPLKTSIFNKAKESRTLQKCPMKQTTESNPKRNCGGAYTVTEPNERVFRQGNLADEFGAKVIQGEVRFVKGADGSMYRAEPEVPKCTCNKPIEPTLICPCPEDEEEEEGKKKETAGIPALHILKEKKKHCPNV